MSRVSPTVEGFRVAFRRPSFTLGEIIWRWAFGATATALIVFGFFEYLDTLPVNYGEMLLLKTNQPFLVWQALVHILHGSLARAVLSLTLAAFLLSLVWMVSASVGRVTTLRAMLEYVRERISLKMSGGGVESAEIRTVSDVPARRAFGTLLRLNFLCLALALATILGFMGASIIAGFASSNATSSPGLVFLLFLPLAVLVGLAWFALSWLLSLAAVFVVREGKDVAGAITAAVALCRERTGAVIAVSLWTGFAHLVAFVGATTLISVPLGLAGFLPWRLVVIAILVLTLAYFAVADWIYTARLAGYLTIVEMPEEWMKPAPPASSRLQTTIDRDEPILSDVPGLALEM